MPAITETRTYVGRDGYAGFVKGRRYPLCYQVLPTGAIKLELDHLLVEMEPLIVSATRFEEWWVLKGKVGPQEEEEQQEEAPESEDE